MKISAIVFATVLIGSTGLAHAASPVEGRWRTPKANAEVEIAPCGNAVCGTIITSDLIKADPARADTKNSDPKLKTRPLKGMQILQGFKGGPEKWTGGRVYNPDDGGTYSGSLTLTDANTLKLRGCALMILCKTQIWHRITE